MKNLIKKSILLGIGAAMIAQEESMKQIHGASKKGKLSEKEFRKYAGKVLKETKRHALKYTVIAEKELEKKIKHGRILTARELRDMRKHVEVVAKDLEKRGRKEVKKW